MFLNEKLGDGYTSKCECGHTTTSKDMRFEVEPTYTRGGKVIAIYTCKKCGEYHKIRTILSPGGY